MTVAAIPWIADHEFPRSPDNASEGDFRGCAPGERWKEDKGLEVTLRREDEAVPVRESEPGEAFREGSLEVPLLGPLSLPSVA